MFNEVGLSSNFEKTERLNIRKENYNTEEIEIENEYVKEAEFVKYLGSVFTKEWYKNREEITQRILKYSRSVCALYPILKDKNILIEAKKAILESVRKLKINIERLEQNSIHWKENIKSNSRPN